MTLIIILNAILCAAVIVTVLTPLAWAILTQHRDVPPAEAQAVEPRRRPEPGNGPPRPRPRAGDGSHRAPPRERLVATRR